MKAIQTGNIFNIHDNSLKTYDALPPNAFLVNFNDKQGFYLTLYSEINVNEKVYGVHDAKVDKVFNSFQKFNRNLGVILSGDKGIGKSLFSKMLASRCIQAGIPLIIVNQYIRGIGEYLNNIEQEVVVLFDEFDKIFKEDRGGSDPQAEMLTLFDGIAQGKKLFLITCNELRGLNNFLVNRPGRFHYHFRFEYPTPEAIREYLTDALDTEHHSEINSVIAFSRKVDLNYDCLRSIAFELNSGLKFKDAIKDLNIMNMDYVLYNLFLYLDNGEVLKTRERLDTFSQEEHTAEFSDTETGEELIYLIFVPASNHYDADNGYCGIDGKNLKLELDSALDEETKKKYKDVKPVKLEFRRQRAKSLHYCI